MSGQRLIQNFRGMRAVLCGAPGAPGAVPETLLNSLESPLRKLGVDLVPADPLDPSDLDPGRDILLLDGDGDLDAMQLSQPGACVPPVPVVGLVGVEAPGRLKALMTRGATAFLRKPVHGAAVYASLFLAVNGFNRLRMMDDRITEHDRRRRGRRFVIKAVVHLMAAHGKTDDEAYEILRRESMRTRQGIEEYCEALIANTAAPPPMIPQSHKETDDEKQVDAHGRAAGGDGLAGRSRAGG
jgi:AmiR/NasT family two-component response regulator